MNRVGVTALSALLLLATGVLCGQMASDTQQVAITGSVVAYDWTLHNKLTHDAYYEQVIVRTTSREVNDKSHLLRVWYARAGADPVLPPEFFQGNTVWTMKLTTAGSLGLCEKPIQWSTRIEELEPATGAKSSREAPRFRTPAGKPFHYRTEDIPCFTLLPDSWFRVPNSTRISPSGRPPEPKPNPRR